MLFVLQMYDAMVLSNEVVLHNFCVTFLTKIIRLWYFVKSVNRHYFGLGLNIIKDF